MSMPGDDGALHINSAKMARLLVAKVRNLNVGRKNKIPVLSELRYKQLIEGYFKSLFSDAIATGEGLSFPFIGNVQVLQRTSNKGWAWDQKYKGHDYDLVVHTEKDITVTVDKKWYPKVLSAVGRGAEYKRTIINHTERLYEILSLLNDGGTRVNGSKRRATKIVT